jgi:hypothetical protein
MAWRVFYSYSHKDTELRDRLGTYLAPLKHQKKIDEWYDRKIQPGAKWETEISARLESADLIMLLVSADFLASDYCFGVELDKAFTRLKRGDVKVVPILLKPCLWQESRFSAIQIIPRDARAITSWGSTEEAFNEVANEISALVSEAPPSRPESSSKVDTVRRFDSSLDLVRGQIRSYARLYERTRQRMQPSDERTDRMEQIFKKMRAIASAAYPLLDELADSPSPGDRLAALAILQCFAAEEFFPFLSRLVGSDKPFVSYHATIALDFAVGSVDPRAHPQLLEAIGDAQAALRSASRGFDNEREKVLRRAEQELRATIEYLRETPPGYD